MEKLKLVNTDKTFRVKLIGKGEFLKEIEPY
jgi:hypothetical protein